MQRMKCWFLWWLLLYYSTRFISKADQQDDRPDRPHTPGPPCSCTAQCKISKKKELQCCMEIYDKHFYDGSNHDIIQSAMDIKKILEETNMTKTTLISTKNIVAAIYKPTGAFSGLEFNANDKEVQPDKDVSDRKVNVRLPKELHVGVNTTVVFCMINLPNTTVNGSDKLYEGKLFGVSVSGKNISGLQERVNITINITTHINNTQEPQCVFLHVSTNSFMTDGCLTLWDQKEITCSCDHLTYFGVLLVSRTLPPTDLSYITITACSICLFALVITVLIFFTNRKLREVDSKKIHISLSVALILFYLHFLPSQAVAKSSPNGFCVYMALGLHYSVLATFSWMALESLHLLLVKFFHIYVRRYLLKLSLVGWGVPAVIVSVVVSINKDYYGHVLEDVSNSNGPAICYLTSSTVKMGFEGSFALVLFFNLIMFGVIIKQFLAAHCIKEFGQSTHTSSRKEICTLLSVMSLLGIPWALTFFLIGHLATPGLCVFSVLNLLQGLVIFIHFILTSRT